MSPRGLRLLFVPYLTATVLHIAWVVAHEPFSFDAWNVAVTTQAKPFTVSRFFEFWHHEYTHSNPRIGQAFAYLAYKLDYFAVVMTPLAYVALATAIFVLGTARWPSWRRGRDLALWTVAIGSLWFALPQFGKTLFCRAYCTNYVYTAAIVLCFLAVVRLVQLERVSRGASVAYFLFGLVAGACNEHTGPTVAALLAGYAFWLHRRGKPARFPAAGALGALLGFLALFFAPGQGERYEGLANRVGLLGRLIGRGVTGNLDILRGLTLAAAPVLALLVIVLLLTRDSGDERRAAVRRALVLVGVAMGAGVAMAVTIFVSPKLGPRFYYVSMALLVAAFIGVLDAAVTRRGLVPFVVLSVVSSIYAAAHTIPLYARAHTASDARIAALEVSKPGTVFVAKSFEQVDESWWFLGDDFRDTRKRDMVAKYFDLTGVVLRMYDPAAPLGVSGARFVAHAELDPPACLDDLGGLAIASSKGFDLATLQHEIQIGIALLGERLQGRSLRALDVAVELDPPLPFPRVLVARWSSASGIEMHIGRIDRESHSTTRKVRVPSELALPDVQIKVYEVDGEARTIGKGNDTALRYVPWRTGIYWILACRADACFVIAATRHSA